MIVHPIDLYTWTLVPERRIRYVDQSKFDDISENDFVQARIKDPAKARFLRVERIGIVGSTARLCIQKLAKCHPIEILARSRKNDRIRTFLTFAKTDFLGSRAVNGPIARPNYARFSILLERSGLLESR